MILMLFCYFDDFCYVMMVMRRFFFQAGKFSLIPTIINAVTAMTSVGIVSIDFDFEKSIMISYAGFCGENRSLIVLLSACSLSAPSSAIGSC